MRQVPQSWEILVVFWVYLCHSECTNFTRGQTGYIPDFVHIFLITSSERTSVWTSCSTPQPSLNLLSVSSMCSDMHDNITSEIGKLSNSLQIYNKKTNFSTQLTNNKNLHKNKNIHLPHYLRFVFHQIKKVPLIICIVMNSLQSTQNANPLMCSSENWRENGPIKGRKRYKFIQLQPKNLVCLKIGATFSRTTGTASCTWF